MGEKRFDTAYLCDADGNAITPIISIVEFEEPTEFWCGVDMGEPLGDVTVTFTPDRASRNYRLLMRLVYGWQAKGPVRKRKIAEAMRKMGRGK